MQTYAKWPNPHQSRQRCHNSIYTLWLFNVAMENGPFIDVFDDLPIKNGDSP
jgi:hypothetical protein